MIKLQSGCQDALRSISQILTRIMVDCCEIECQCPSGLMIASIIFSNYKGRNTWKVLLGCTPSGLVSFVSDAWGVWISDQ